MICFVGTASTEDVGVELHDAADACTLVVSLSATRVLSLFELGFSRTIDQEQGEKRHRSLFVVTFAAAVFVLLVESVE